MASEEKTSAADIPLKSHEEVTSAASIPLKSHEEVVPGRRRVRKSKLDGCAADVREEMSFGVNDFPVKSNREVENQIDGCAADFPYQRRHVPVQIQG
ncbi:hypothetical protein OIU77_026419, partial [Salix suchowensis]